MSRTESLSPSKRFEIIEKERFEKFSAAVTNYQACITDRLRYTSMEISRCSEAMKPVESFLSDTRKGSKSPYRQHVLSEYIACAKRCDAKKSEESTLSKYQKGLSRYRLVMDTLRMGENYKDLDKMRNSLREDN